MRAERSRILLVVGVAGLTVLAALFVLLEMWRAAGLVSLFMLAGALAVAIDGRWWTGRVSSHVLGTHRQLRTTTNQVLRVNASIRELSAERERLATEMRRVLQAVGVMERRMLGALEAERLRSMDAHVEWRRDLDGLKSIVETIPTAIDASSRKASDGAASTTARIETMERRLLGSLEAQRLLEDDRFEAAGRVLEDWRSYSRETSETQMRTASALALLRERLESRFDEVAAHQSDAAAELNRTLRDAENGVADLRQIVDGRVLELAQGLDQLQADLRHLPHALSVHTTTISEQIDSLGADIGASCASRERLEAVYHELRTLSEQMIEWHGDIEEALPEGSSVAALELNARLVNSAVRKLTAVARDETRQVEALLQLQRHVDPIAPLPPSGRWAMDARSLLHLCHVIEDVEPRRVLELGGGTSTIWLGYLLSNYGGRLVSVDHDETFAALTAEAVDRHGLGSVVDVRCAGLSPVQLKDGPHEWYGEDAFHDVEEVDFLVVDGPPGNIGHGARYPALPVLFDRLASDCIVVLDDSERPDEQEALQSWLAEYPDFEVRDQGVSRLCVLQRRGAR